MTTETKETMEEKLFKLYSGFEEYFTPLINKDKSEYELDMRNRYCRADVLYSNYDAIKSQFITNPGLFKNDMFCGVEQFRQCMCQIYSCDEIFQIHRNYKELQHEFDTLLNEYRQMF